MPLRAIRTYSLAAGQDSGVLELPGNPAILDLGYDGAARLVCEVDPDAPVVPRTIFRHYRGDVLPPDLRHIGSLVERDWHFYARDVVTLPDGRRAFVDPAAPPASSAPAAEKPDDEQEVGVSLRLKVVADTEAISLQGTADVAGAEVRYVVRIDAQKLGELLLDARRSKHKLVETGVITVAVLGP